MQDIAWKQILIIGGIGLVIGLAAGTFLVAPMVNKKKEKAKTAAA